MAATKKTAQQADTTKKRVDTSEKCAELASLKNRLVAVWYTIAGCAECRSGVVEDVTEGALVLRDPKRQQKDLPSTLAEAVAIEKGAAAPVGKIPILYTIPLSRVEKVEAR